MAKHKIFTIFDEKVKSYSPPFYSVHKGQALRSWEELVNDGGKSTISKYPKDFSLYELGEFDDQQAKVILHLQPEFVADALTYLRQGSDLPLLKAMEK